MEFINKVEIQGVVNKANVTDCQGKKQAKLSVVTERVYRDKNGTATLELKWWLVRAVEGYSCTDLDKIVHGSVIHVKGFAQDVKYVGEDGQEKTMTTIVAKFIEIQNGVNTLTNKYLEYIEEREHEEKNREEDETTGSVVHANSDDVENLMEQFMREFPNGDSREMAMYMFNHGLKKGMNEGKTKKT